MNLPKTGKIPLGKLQNILQYATNLPRDDGTYLACWTAGHIAKHWPSRPSSSLISKLQCEQIWQMMYRSNAPNKSRRWKYKTRLYDHNYFGPVQQHQENILTSTSGPNNTAEMVNSTEQAGGHSINTRPSYKALSISRQQQNKLFPCII